MTRDIIPQIIERERDWKCVYIYMVTSWHMLVTIHPLHYLVQSSTTMVFVALYSLIYDNNQTRTKRKAIEEVNQTVKSVFELMYLSPVHV